MSEKFHYVSDKDAMKMLNKSKVTLWRYRKSKKLPYYVSESNHVFYNLYDIEKLKELRRVN